MQLNQVIDSIRYGELINLSWDDNKRIPAIITYINQAVSSDKYVCSY